MFSYANSTKGYLFNFAVEVLVSGILSTIFWVPVLVIPVFKNEGDEGQSNANHNHNENAT